MKQLQHVYARFTRQQRKSFTIWKFIFASIYLIFSVTLFISFIFVFPAVPLWQWLFVVPAVLILAIPLIVLFAISLVFLVVVAIVRFVFLFYFMPWWLLLICTIAAIVVCGALLLYVKITRKMSEIQYKKFVQDLSHGDRTYEQGYQQQGGVASAGDSQMFQDILTDDYEQPQAQYPDQ